MQLQWVAEEVLKYIPGSNSASASCHISGHPHYKIITEIISGVPNHLVLDMRDNSTQPLNIFIDNLINAATANTNSEAISALITATDSVGNAINITGLI